MTENIIPLTPDFGVPESYLPKEDIKRHLMTADFISLSRHLRDLGYDKSVAIVSAATWAGRGNKVNIIAEMGLQVSTAQKEKALTPTQLGISRGIKPKQINLLLQEKGLQTPFRDEKKRLSWILTEEGKKFGEYELLPKKHLDGTPVRRIVWYKQVETIIFA